MGNTEEHPLRGQPDFGWLPLGLLGSPPMQRGLQHHLLGCASQDGYLDTGPGDIATSWFLILLPRNESLLHILYLCCASAFTLYPSVWGSDSLSLYSGGPCVFYLGAECFAPDFILGESGSGLST